MAKYRVVHINKYSFQESVKTCSLEAKLQPANSHKQTVEFSQLVTRPLANTQTQSIDKYGNHVCQLEFTGGLQAVELSAIHTVTTNPQSSIDLASSLAWEQVRAVLIGDAQLLSFIQNTTFTSASDALVSYADISFTPGRPILEAANELMQRIYQDFNFDLHVSNVKTTAEQAFDLKSGVCQDFTHIAIACIRSQKLATRYVSGYVDTKSESRYFPKIAADVSHAWFSIYEPSYGWVDFDPTNNRMPGDSYVVIAHGRDYKDVTPLSGYTHSSGKHHLTVKVDMTVV